MLEPLFATALFWAAFTFSAGPFWTATMAAATTMSFASLYREYIMYLIFGWLPLLGTISFVVATIGGINETINLALYFIGALVIFYLAWKIFKTKPGVAKGFNFDFKAMSLLSWTNPKVWLVVPIGFLSADITQSTLINIGLFYLIGIPFFLTGVFVWGTIGRLGAKISLEHINKFNALLMAAFGVYLLYAGLQLTNKMQLP